MHTPSNKCSRERDPVKTASDVNPADIRYQPPRRMFKINNISAASINDERTDFP